MAGVVVLLTVVLISIVTTRVATVALAATGVSEELARFQARSAFSGVGFTTSEAERMTDHPARRRIILMLMLAGNAGLVTAVASIVFAVVETNDTTSAVLRGGTLIAGLLLMYLLTRSARVEAALRHRIERALRRWTDLDVRDYESLLAITGDYTVMEIRVDEGDWLAERPLGDLNLPDEGVVVLGVERGGGKFLGAPSPEVVAEAGDKVILYGRSEAVRDVSGRAAGVDGDEQHRASKRKHDVAQSEDERDDSGERRPTGGSPPKPQDSTAES